MISCRWPAQATSADASAPSPSVQSSPSHSSAVAEAPPQPKVRAQLVGADRVEGDVDEGGADFMLDDGAVLHVEARTSVHVSFTRAVAQGKGRRQLTATYAVEASAVARLTVALPYAAPAGARVLRPCNVTPYPPLTFKGELTRQGTVTRFARFGEVDGPRARLVLNVGYSDIEASLRATFALFDTDPCHG